MHAPHGPINYNLAYEGSYRAWITKGEREPSTSRYKLLEFVSLQSENMFELSLTKTKAAPPQHLKLPAITFLTCTICSFQSASVSKPKLEYMTFCYHDKPQMWACVQPTMPCGVRTAPSFPHMQNDIWEQQSHHCSDISDCWASSFCCLPH